MPTANSLTSKIALCFLGLVTSLLAACQSPQSIAATPSIVPNVDQLLTPTPFVWPLAIQFDDANHPMKASVGTLLQLTPGVSTMEDIYRSIGYPRKRKDFPDSIALLYPSLWPKSPHVVILDGKSGKALVISIENVSKPIFSLSNLKAAYGEPISIDEGGCLFFQNAGVATLMAMKDNGRLLCVQKFPKELTLEQYESHQCYWSETNAFLP